jgi:hypothetical protein
VQDVQTTVFLKAHLASIIAQTFENRGVQSAGEFGRIKCPKKNKPTILF